MRAETDEPVMGRMTCYRGVRNSRPGPRQWFSIDVSRERIKAIFHRGLHLRDDDSVASLSVDES
jgi:hypothetical protein